MQPLKMSSSISDGEWHSFYINDKLNYYHNPIYKRIHFELYMNKEKFKKIDAKT